jgi:hypothetical protein
MGYVGRTRSASFRTDVKDVVTRFDHTPRNNGDPLEGASHGEYGTIPAPLPTVRSAPEQ